MLLDASASHLEHPRVELDADQPSARPDCVLDRLEVEADAAAHVENDLTRARRESNHGLATEVIAPGRALVIGLGLRVLALERALQVGGSRADEASSSDVA